MKVDYGVVMYGHRIVVRNDDGMEVFLRDAMKLSPSWQENLNTFNPERRGYKVILPFPIKDDKMVSSYSTSGLTSYFLVHILIA